jgi:ribosomal protein L18E
MTDSFRYKDATFLGEPTDEIINKKIVVSVGRRADDMNFVAGTLTVGDLIEQLAEFQRGDKDGKCLVPGKVVQGRRLAKAMEVNTIAMIDLDNGTPWELLAPRIEDLFYIAWTTHSHGKGETEVAEAALTRYLSKHKETPGFEDVEIMGQCIRYLRDEKQIAPAVLASVHGVERRMTGSGVVSKVKHAPMARWRILFVLEEPFYFTQGGTQADRIELWKKSISGLCTALDLPYDRSCTDPSRLMYVPRIAKDADIEQHKILVHPGKLLDLAQFTEHEMSVEDLPAGFQQYANAHTGEASANAYEPKTPGLKQFVGKYPDFDAVSYLRDVDPEGEVPGGRDPSKVTWHCPNVHNHTEQKQNDQAFVIFQSPDSWGMNCMHATCTEMSGKDRLWYLDQICVAVGVTDPFMSLGPYSETWRDEQKAEGEARKLAATPATVVEGTMPSGPTLEDLVQALDDKSTSEDINKILRSISMVEDEFRAERLAKRVAKFTKVSLTKVNRKIKEFTTKREFDQDGPVQVVTGHPVPEDLSDLSSPVWLDWDPEVKFRATVAKLLRANERKPFLFRRPEGGVVRVERSVDGRMRAVEMLTPQWHFELMENVRFKETDPLGMDRSVDPPKQIVLALQGARNLDLPEFRQISRVAIFDRDGGLRGDRGYDEGNKVYIDPNYEALPVPAKPSDDEVAAARELLFETIRDFPFSDVFEDIETQQIKTDNRDADGFLIPNWKRGRSSRANALAMILQPFARNLIDGPTPAYHFDKPAPGTGAGFLADVAHIIAEGTPPAIQTMSLNNEEFRKAITSVLREGASVIFVDNINRKVDSGDLAGALTSGVWRDRILGQTQTVTIPVQAMWILAGNNLSFSNELMRRNVPIRLDAATPRPAHDRGRDAFKHFPLQPWLHENRPRFIQAAQILIANWLARGSPRGSGFIHSFDQWSFVMSGILECAGVDGFLKNVPAYLNMKDEDNSGQNFVVQKIVERYGLATFTPGMAIDCVKDPLTDKLMPEVPVSGSNDHAQLVSFGMWFKKTVAGATFELMTKEGLPGDATDALNQMDSMLVKCVATKSGGSVKYRFVVTKKQ